MKIFRLLACGLLMHSTVFARPPADIQARLDRFVHNRPGGIAVAWVDADGVAYFSAGHFSAMDPRAITPDTQFEIGSITKVFTSLLLAESERLGKVNRQDSVGQYLLPPGDPAQKDLAKITLLSLATHSSGLPRLPGDFSPWTIVTGNPYAKATRADLVTSLEAEGPTAATGRLTGYSNFGVALLGEALAAAWGTTYEDALRTHVLTPLGLDHTIVGAPGRPASPELAPPHEKNKPGHNWEFAAYAPCGALRSSARELAKLLQACLGDERAPLHAALKVTTTRQRDLTDLPAAIGFNWMLVGDESNPVVWHNGATGGYRSWIGFMRSRGVGVVILTNHDAGVDHLGERLLGFEGQMFRPTRVSDGAAYEGRYKLSPTITVEVTSERDGLFAETTSQPPRPLGRIGPEDFAVLGSAMELTFERDAAGKVTGLVRHYVKRDQRGVREPLPPRLKVTAAKLAEYEGKYPLRASLTLTVTVVNGELIVQGTDQAPFRCRPVGSDEFQYEQLAARITFLRDAGGQVVSLVLHQNGQDFPAKRTP